MANMELLPASNLIIDRKIQHTKGQLEALDLIIKWSKTNDYAPFTLSGFAGTGKTTILKDISRNIVGKLACTAPTHKAARVISVAIGLESCTIQSLLGLRPNTDLENFDINKPQFDILAAANIRKYTHIFVDEGSMINAGLFKLLTDEAIRYKVKILFIGDPYQLPPVGEAYSKVFLIPNLYNLTEIVRQEENNPIIKLLVIARDDVKNKTNKLVEFVSKRQSNYDSTNDRGFLITDNNHFAQLLHDKFSSSEFERDVDFCRYLAYTNESVSGTNQYIRNWLFNNPEHIVTKDDLFTSYSTVFDEFNSPIIINSEDYIINSILNYNNKYLLQGYLVSLRKINGGEITDDLFILDHSVRDNIDRYVSIIAGLLSKTKSTNVVSRRLAWEKFWEFKNYNLLLNSIYSSTGKMITSKDLDYGFGLTVHKSQGSTFDNVFVNLKDVIYTKSGVPYRDVNLRNRLIYVALSRARNNLYILI